ncbi:hypothetical protein HMPREF0972_02467 [Actinomyces sp. oral taxon 848 str. F0332]|nr:hypothetical protein HMPREF0972_02467 [Actinomyces sp. oral taxon 848 str. F0332]
MRKSFLRSYGASSFSTCFSALFRVKKFTLFLLKVPIFFSKLVIRHCVPSA